MKTHHLLVSLASINSFGTTPNTPFLPQDIPNVCLSISVFHAVVQEVAYRLSFGRDGFQVSLKILKVILCRDFLAFDIIHHFPE